MTISCQVCDKAVGQYRHDWLFRCEGCGVLSSNFPIDIPKEVTAGRIDEAARATGLDPLRRKNNSVLLANLLKFAPKDAQLLDVGCGPGFLLGQAAVMGLDVQGIEPDANVAEAARAHGVQVRLGFFPNVLGPDDLFDVIVFNDVLEHIPDLRSALAAANSHLRPGGVLVLNCPDMRGLFYRVASLLDRLGVPGPYDRLWQKGLPSPHVWYFTPALLQRAVARDGLKMVGSSQLQTIEIDGLWSRIMLDRSTPFALALASFLFSVAIYPLMKVLPSDAVAVYFQKSA